MKNKYSIEDIEDILLQNGIKMEFRGKRTKGDDLQRPERVIKGILEINIPPKTLYYQIRLCDNLYYQIKNDSRLNINNLVNFPIDDFINEKGKIIKYNNMLPEMRRHFDEVYGKVESMKTYSNYKNQIEKLTENRTVYCINHGAVEKSNINKGKLNLIILFTPEDMDIVIDHIIFYMKKINNFCN